KFFTFIDNNKKFKMYIGFYHNFTAEDLLTKVTYYNDPIPNKQGASVQFNANKCLSQNNENKIFFRHPSIVTIGTRIPRKILENTLHKNLSCLCFELILSLLIIKYSD